MQNEYSPKSVTHPGTDLEELLDHYGISLEDFSRKIEESENTIQSIINGNAPITKEIALKLSESLGVPSRYWLRRQEKYDECIVSIEEIGDTEKKIGIDYKQYSISIPGWKTVYTVEMSKGFVNKLKEVFVEAGYKLKN